MTYMTIGVLEFHFKNKRSPYPNEFGSSRHWYADVFFEMTKEASPFFLGGGIFIVEEEMTLI